MAGGLDLLLAQVCFCDEQDHSKDFLTAIHDSYENVIWMLGVQLGLSVYSDSLLFVFVTFQFCCDHLQPQLRCLARPWVAKLASFFKAPMARGQFLRKRRSNVLSEGWGAFGRSSGVSRARFVAKSG